MDSDAIERVAVIGCGMIGPDIAAVLVMHGITVALVGIDQADLERGLGNVRRDLEDLQSAGILTEQSVGQALDRLSGTSSIADGVKPADLVFEAVPEDVSVKQSVFAELEQHSRPGTLLCSSTSGLSPQEIAAPLADKSRMAVTHFWNPPYLVPLVEIIPHAEMDEPNRRRVERFIRSLGKEPVFLKKDIAGHIGNRLQHALYREALYLIEEGVATPGDIDRVVLNSFGPRFAVIGPMEYFDSCGLDLHQKVQSYLYPTLCSASEVQSIVLTRIAKGNLGSKTGAGLYDWSNRNESEFRRRRNSGFLERLRREHRNEQETPQ